MELHVDPKILKPKSPINFYAPPKYTEVMAWLTLQSYMILNQRHILMKRQVFSGENSHAQSLDMRMTVGSPIYYWVCTNRSQRIGGNPDG